MHVNVQWKHMVIIISICEFEFKSKIVAFFFNNCWCDVRNDD